MKIPPYRLFLTNGTGQDKGGREAFFLIRLPRLYILGKIREAFRMGNEKIIMEAKIQMLQSKIKMENMKDFEIFPAGTPENQGKLEAIEMVLAHFKDNDLDVIVEAIKQLLIHEQLSLSGFNKNDSPDYAKTSGRIKALIDVLLIIGEVTKKP